MLLNFSELFVAGHNSDNCSLPYRGRRESVMGTRQTSGMLSDVCEGWHGMVFVKGGMWGWVVWVWYMWDGVGVVYVRGWCMRIRVM